MADKFVDDYLLYLLARASALVSGQFHARLKPHGIDVAEWRILATLSDGAGMTIGELVDIVLLQQPTVTKIIDRMADLNLVERHRDTSDRRKVHLFITPVGRKKVRGVLADARRHETEVLAGYSVVESANLKNVLRTLIERQAIP